MISISISSDQNYIFVKSTGVICPADVKKIIPQLKAAMESVSAGFTIIHDISQLRTFDPENFEHLKTIHKMLLENGAGRIIRVVGSARDTLFKFAKFDKENDLNKAEFVPDLETALAVLAEPEQTKAVN